MIKTINLTTCTENLHNISFKYGGEDFCALPKSMNIHEKNSDGILNTVYEYSLDDELKITTTIKFYEKYGAYEWVTYFENTSENDSKIISELCDCDIKIPFEYDKPQPSDGFYNLPNVAKIYNPFGSIWSRTEFSSVPEDIMPGKSKYFATNGGRSSQQRAPFLDINKEDYGVMVAIGWTGQWFASVSRDDSDINIKTGIENVAFKLLPGEKIRTSSVVVMQYFSSQNDGHNKFRRLIKEHFSLIGKDGRDETGPLCHMFWGSRKSEKMIEIINKLKEHEAGFEYIWVDAGWYGTSTEDCLNEFEGDWPMFTGDWRINKSYHPDNFQEVTKTIKNADMKFLLWFEVERCIKTTPIVQEHPEWFIFPESGDNTLLNLGIEEANDYITTLLCEKIKELNISCYRQDFNFDPLGYWDKNDTPDRKGITQIKHIMGLYKFWDALLEKNPHLIIDNCASGGRRIDIEMLRRSMPMWRSDYQCPWNCDSETTQTHGTSFSWWMPYSGSGGGNVLGDTYRSRGSYGASYVVNYWGYEGWEFDESYMPWVRKINAEYKKVRPFMSCDFYPHTLSPLDNSNWCISQYNRPENNDGMILAFRRPLSVCPQAEINLGGIDKDKTYIFTNEETNEEIEISGKKLLAEPFNLSLPQKRSSLLLFYKAK